jgi:hypothetical protein
MDTMCRSDQGLTKHAMKRSQQRAIPPLVDEWLAAYGAEQYDGAGGVVVYFSRDSVRRLERAFGRKPVQLMSRYLDCYKVLSAHDGRVITIGHRFQRIARR